MIERKDFFEDIAVALDTWAQTATDATTNPEADLLWVENEGPYRGLQDALSGIDESVIREVFAECLRGFAVSLLTGLDGGSALAEKGRLYLVDERGQRLGEGLHNDFVGHLMDTGRLK